MAKKSFARKTQRTIVGAAKSSAARIQKIAITAATAAATAAAASRCRSGSEVNARRRQGGEVNESGEKAGAQVKAKYSAQGVEKEKTLNRVAVATAVIRTVAAHRAARSANSPGSGGSLWNGKWPAELTIPVAGDWDRSKLENAMSVGTIILIILVIALLGGFSGIGGGPFYGTGYYGGGGLGLVIVVLLILLLLGKL